MYAQKLSFDYAHTLHTVRIVHNAHSVHRSRVQKGQSCDCINFVRATEKQLQNRYPTEGMEDVFSEKMRIKALKKEHEASMVVSQMETTTRFGESAPK